MYLRIGVTRTWVRRHNDVVSLRHAPTHNIGWLREKIGTIMKLPPQNIRLASLGGEVFGDDAMLCDLGGAVEASIVTGDPSVMLLPDVQAQLQGMVQAQAQADAERATVETQPSSSSGVNLLVFNDALAQIYARHPEAAARTHARIAHANAMGAQRKRRLAADAVDAVDAAAPIEEDAAAAHHRTMKPQTMQAILLWLMANPDAIGVLQFEVAAAATPAAAKHAILAWLQAHPVAAGILQTNDSTAEDIARLNEALRTPHAVDAMDVFHPPRQQPAPWQPQAQPQPQPQAQAQPQPQLWRPTPMALHAFAQWLAANPAVARVLKERQAQGGCPSMPPKGGLQ